MQFCMREYENFIIDQDLLILGPFKSGSYLAYVRVDPRRADLCAKDPSDETGVGSRNRSP